MGDKERESNGYGGFVGPDGQPVDLKIQNGFAAAADYKKILYHNSVGSSSNTLRTYKRRKKNHTHDDQVSESLQVQVNEKFTNEISHMAVNKLSTQTENIANIGAYNIIHASDGALVKQQRNYCLQQMFTSLEGGNGLRECIQDALVFNSESGCSHAVKESIHSCEDLGKCAAFSLSGPHQTAHSGIPDVTFSASEKIIDDRRVTKLCQQAFFDVITSEKFALMCRVLENFGGAKAHRVFDITGIDSRMKEGVYESSPVLFLSDTEQLWMNLQKVGSDIVSLANGLLETSRTAYHEQFATEVSDMHAKVEQTETKGTYKIRTCKCCKGKADVRDSLVCDSCEEMYHVSCIKPAVKEIPSRSWYCASCTSKGIESPHENCVVCERLNASRLLGNTDTIDELISDDDLEESSNGLSENDVQLSKGKNMPCCKVCKTDVQSSEELRICGHAFCPHKFYHARCLNRKQLNCFGPLWYCPSCLCRACFIDCDDEKIVLCDACDDAYHIYCMEPPRTMIPRGKWYCSKCDSELRRIRKAKRTYENLQIRLSNLPEHRKASHEDSSISGVNGKAKEALENSGAVDMLLKAATTLNNEENLAGTDIKKL